MRKYRLSTKYRGQKSHLVDFVGLSSINHPVNHYGQNGNNLNQNLNKVYIRNFYEYHHRKRPGEGKTAKQEYDKELKEESKKQRLKDLENFDKSSSSFDSTEDDEIDDKIDETKSPINGHMNGHTSGHMNGHTSGQMNGQMNGHMNGYETEEKIKKTVNGNSNKHQLLNGNNDTHFKNENQSTNSFKPRKSIKTYIRPRNERSSKEFFDVLLSKSVNFENEYKKCAKTYKELVEKYKELNLAKQMQAYQLESLTDDYDDLDDTYNELYRKFKFINRECKLIDKDIERLKNDYCKLVKQDLIKKNTIIKENDYIPILNEIPSIDLDRLGDLNNYERAFDKFTCRIDFEMYKKLTKINNSQFILNGSCDSLNSLKDELVDENNNQIKIEMNGFDKQIDQNNGKIKKELSKQETDEKNKIKQQVDNASDLINKPDCKFICNKAIQLTDFLKNMNAIVQENISFKNKIKRLQFEISNEKRNNEILKNGTNQPSNSVVKFEFSDNLDKLKSLSRHARHTINVVGNPRSSKLTNHQFNSRFNDQSSSNKIANRTGTRSSNLNIFEIPTQKVELFQMKMKMQKKDLELKINQAKKMKELIESKLEMQKLSLEKSQETDQFLKEQKQLNDDLKKLKIKEQQLLKENDILLKKVHKLTEK